MTTLFAALAALPIDHVTLSSAVIYVLFSLRRTPLIRDLAYLLLCSWAFDRSDLRELVRDLARKRLKGK